VLLRLSSDFRRAMDLSLVLEQEGIPHELRRVDHARWGLEIDDQDAARAEAAISAFELENPPEVRRPERRLYPITGAVASGVAFSLALLAVYVRTGPESAGSAWFERGSANAVAMLHGEWWRTVTALTLHADAPHVAGNAVLGGILLALLARSVGPGLASALMLLSGVAGTFAAALLRRDSVSIGASTAVFGTLGALAALPRYSRRVWMPLIGALVLLALLGTSKRADVAGHLSGFLCGVLAGAAVSLLPPLRSRAGQACLAIAAAVVPLAAWLAAFR
jgi:membrane associated rhomboid family serine protease